MALWDTPRGQGLDLSSIQLPFSPAIIQPEVEQLLGPCHPHILSVTLLRDIMYRGARTTPPPSYLPSQLWMQAPRGLHLRLRLLTTSAREGFQPLHHCYREHSLPTPSSHQAPSSSPTSQKQTLLFSQMVSTSMDFMASCRHSALRIILTPRELCHPAAPAVWCLPLRTAWSPRPWVRQGLMFSIEPSQHTRALQCMTCLQLHQASLGNLFAAALKIPRSCSSVLWIAVPASSPLCTPKAERSLGPSSTARTFKSLVTSNFQDSHKLCEECQPNPWSQ